MRIGHGYDVHRLDENRKLILCGVEIPHEKGLLGHSDADVATHALTDAVLGAAALGDIGHLFPDSDARFKDADSLEMLGSVISTIDDMGFYVVNADITIIAQAPRLAEYIETMRENIASVCGTDVSDINVKATTTEHLGFEGEKKGISAHAVVLIEKHDYMDSDN